MRRAHRVACLTYPGMSPFELSIALEVFALPRPELDVDTWYAVDVCSAQEQPAELPAVGGIQIVTRYGLGRLRYADTIIVPGWPVSLEVPAALSRTVARAHDRGVRLVSICSGAFVLAAAGVLDGRRAATHWQYADILAARYPRIRVDPEVLYVDEGSVLTSAGSAAGIDLCLHIVRTDHGAKVANQVARRLVVAAHRDGGQAQFIERAVAVEGDTAVHAVLEWMQHHLEQPMTIAQLARRAHLSGRHFTRRFREITGEAPSTWLITQRVQASLDLLEQSTASVPEIAVAVGFGNDVTYRHHFRARMRTSPTDYRRAFNRSRTDQL